MKHVFLFAALALLTCTVSANAQTMPEQKPVRRTDTQSVVVLPEAQRPHIDTAALKPGKQKKHRRFKVEIVPAPPPGRSWQEIRYSDSLGRK